MVGTAARANLKGLEEKHSLGMWRRQIGRILEKGWQEGRLHSMSKRWRGSRLATVEGSSSNETTTALEWEGYREEREQGKGEVVEDLL